MARGILRKGARLVCAGPNTRRDIIAKHSAVFSIVESQASKRSVGSKSLLPTIRTGGGPPISHASGRPKAEYASRAY